MWSLAIFKRWNGEGWENLNHVRIKNYKKDNDLKITLMNKITYHMTCTMMWSSCSNLIAMVLKLFLNLNEELNKNRK